MKRFFIIIALLCLALSISLFYACDLSNNIVNTNNSNVNNGNTDDNDSQGGSEDGSGEDNTDGGNEDDEQDQEDAEPQEPLEEVMFEGFRFNLKKDKTYKVTYCGVSSSEIVLPGEVNGVAVTSIGDDAFRSMYFQKLTLPESVIEIGDSAFAYNSTLKEINLDNVEVICERAFMNCSSLKDINLASASKIEKNAFANCSLLTSVNMPNLLWLKENAFSSCVSLQTVEIGDRCIQIFADSFRGCSCLTSVTLGSSDGYWYYYLVRTDETGDQIRGENNTGSVAGFGEKLEDPTACAQFLTKNHNAGVFFAQYEYFETYCNLSFDPTLEQYQLPRKNMYT